MRGVEESDWSEIWSFTTGIGTPTLLHPENDSTFQPADVTLKWTEVEGAISYRLTVAADGDPASSGIDTTTRYRLQVSREADLPGVLFDTTTSDSIVVVQLPGPGSYTWYVTNGTDDEWGTPSDTNEFVIQPPSSVCYGADATAIGNVSLTPNPAKQSTQVRFFSRR